MFIKKCIQLIDNSEQYIAYHHKSYVIRIIFDFLMTCTFTLKNDSKYKETIYNKLIHICALSNVTSRNIDDDDINKDEKFNFENENEIIEKKKGKKRNIDNNKSKEYFSNHTDKKFENPYAWSQKYFNYIFDQIFILGVTDSNIHDNGGDDNINDYDYCKNENNIDNHYNAYIQYKEKKIFNLSDNLINNHFWDKPSSPFLNVIETFVSLNKKISKDDRNYNYNDNTNSSDHIITYIPNIDFDTELNDRKNLWSLSDLNGNTKYRMGFPKHSKIIIPPSYKNLSNVLPLNLDEFKCRLKKNKLTNDLYDFDFKNNIIMAGGALTSILSNEKIIVGRQCSASVHLFFYNLIDDAPDKKENKIGDNDNNMINLALKHAERLRRHLISKWGCKNLRIFVSSFHITFVNIKNNHQIQLILHNYSTILDVLNDFDLGTISIAWDNKNNLYFNSNGKFTYETGLNIVSRKKYNSDYEQCLQKYLLHGFGIIFTNDDFVVDEKMIQLGKLEIHLKNELEIKKNDDESYQYQDQDQEQGYEVSVYESTYTCINDHDDHGDHGDRCNIDSSLSLLESELDIDRIYYKNLNTIMLGQDHIQDLIGFVDNVNFIGFKETRIDGFLPSIAKLSEILKKQLTTENGLVKTLKFFQKDEKCCMKIINFFIVGHHTIDWEEMIVSYLKMLMSSINLKTCILEFRKKKYNKQLIGLIV